MGTLGNQPERNQFHVNKNDLEHFLEDANILAKKHNISVESVINAKHALELERKNNITVQSGDYTDEQMGGLGIILSRIADTLESLKN